MKIKIKQHAFALALFAALPAALNSCALPASSNSSAQQDTTSDVNLPPYNGPRARVVLDDFDWGVGQADHEGAGSAAIETTYEDEDGTTRRSTTTIAVSQQSNKVCTGLHASLRQSLMSTNRFIVADRKGIDNLRNEQKLKDQGIADKKSGAAIGNVQGADLLIRGTVLEWEEDSGGSSAGGGGLFGFTEGLTGGLVGVSSQKGRVVVLVEVVDIATMDTLASAQVVGDASGSSLTFGGFGWTGGAALVGGFQQYEKKPMGDAIRKAIAGSVKMIAEEVPEDYFRHAPGRAGGPKVAATPRQG